MNKPIMFTTDIALIKDPAYLKISKHFHDNPAEFDEAFAKAWYIAEPYRDMGPSRLARVRWFQSRSCGKDPVPDV